jgi:hypothetical protein
MTASSIASTLLTNVFVVFSLVSLIACVAPTTQTLQIDAESYDLSEGSYVIFPLDSSSAEDKKFAHCVEKSILRIGSTESNLIRHNVFQDHLMPWFENTRMPKTVEELETALNRPLVRERIDSLSIRYLVYLSYNETYNEEIPALFCGGGYGGAGCLGLGSFERESNAAAIVWDLKSASRVSELRATATGTTTMAGIIIPFGFVALTEKDACRKMSTGLASYFAERSPGELPNQ